MVSVSMKLAYRSPMRCGSVPSAAFGRGGLGDDVAHLLLGPVGEQPKGAVGGAVGRHPMVCQPATVDVTEQVVLRAGTSVDIAQVDARADSFYRHAIIVTRPALLPG